MSRWITADDKDNTFLFRTYDHPVSDPRWAPKYPGEAHRYKIWEVARATSAAPTYFKAALLKDPENPAHFEEFSDGGPRNNNPAEVAYNEILRKEKWYEGVNNQHPIHLFLSIGTGQSPSKSKRLKQKLSLWNHFRSRRSILTRLTNALTDPDDVDEDARLRMEGDAKRPYFRWTGGANIAQLKLDCWRDAKKPEDVSTQQFIEESTRKYVAHAEVQKEIKRCARELVEHRRNRVHDLDRWTRFTHCTLLHCPYCSRKENTRSLLKEHIETDHSDYLPHFSPDGGLENNVSRLTLHNPRIPGGPH